MKLNPKQLRFVDEYLVDLNATGAATRAGYSAKTAYQQGHELLKHPEIIAKLNERMRARAKRTEITQDRVLQEIARLAFFDLRKLYDNQGAPLAMTQLDDDTAAAVAGLEISTADDGAWTVRKYKLADKLRALQQCMDHLGMGKQRIELSGHLQVSQLSDDEITAQLAELLRVTDNDPGTA